MRTQTFVVILFCVAVISYSTTRLVRSVMADSPSKPNHIESGNVKFQVDLLVMKYPKNVRPSEDEFQDAARKAMAKHKSKHVIIMPDDYTPVGIPKSQFNEVKRFVGDNFFSIDNLACEKEECLDVP